MKQIILCGDDGWLSKMEHEVKSLFDVEIKLICSLYPINFTSAKKMIKNSDLVIANIEDDKDTTLQVLTIAQCYDIPVTGIVGDIENTLPRYFALCDEFCDSNSNNFSGTLHNTIDIFI